MSGTRTDNTVGEAVAIPSAINGGEPLPVSGEPVTVDFGNGTLFKVKPLRRSALNALVRTVGLSGDGNLGEMLQLLELAFRAGCVEALSKWNEQKLRTEKHPHLGTILSAEAYDDFIDTAAKASGVTDTSEIVARLGEPALGSAFRRGASGGGSGN